MAAFDSYATLQTTALAWANRQGDTDLVARIPDIIDVVEPEIDSLLRRTTNIATVQVSANPTALPLDLKQLRSIRLFSSLNPSASWPLKVVSYDMLQAYWQQTGAAGTPCWASILGSNLYVSPLPDQIYTVEVAYFTKLVPLSATNPTNVVLQNYPHIYLMGILKEMAPYLEQPQEGQEWSQKFYTLIEQANTDRAREETAAGFKPLYLNPVFTQ